MNDSVVSERNDTSHRKHADMNRHAESLATWRGHEPFAFARWWSYSPTPSTGSDYRLGGTHPVPGPPQTSPSPRRPPLPDRSGFPKDKNGAPRRWPSGATRYPRQGHLARRPPAGRRRARGPLGANGTAPLGSAKPPAPSETNAWDERFTAYRRQEVGSVDDDACRWAKWIAPHIGAKPIVSVMLERRTI